MGAITTEMQWLMGELLKLEPGSQNGGIYANKSGYHNTRNNHLANRPGDYSIQDGIDREGPGDKAGAFDWTFPDAQAGRYATIAKYMSRIVASGQDQDDPRLNGWREFYGQADGDRAVEGWDSRYLVPVTSDSSHLWHIHGSVARKYANDLPTMKALLSVLKGETVSQWLEGEDDMSTFFDNITWSGDEKQSPMNRLYRSYRAAESADKKIDALAKEVAELKAIVAKQQTGGVDVDALADKLFDAFTDKLANRK